MEDGCIPSELREGAVRLIAESRQHHDSEWAAMCSSRGQARCRDAGDGAQVRLSGMERARGIEPA